MTGRGSIGAARPLFSASMNVGLNNRVAWVSGAAGGIGRAIAESLADHGARVVATDRQSPGWSTSERVTHKTCNVTQLDAISETADYIDREFGGIDILVNSAGIMHRDDVLELSTETWDRVMSVNLKGAFFTAQAAARSMVTRNRPGSIINISSINSEVVFPHSIAYSSSKGGLRTMTRALAVALGPHGIRVNAIGPGAVEDTNLETQRWASPEASTLNARTPLGRVGRVRDIAPAAVFLAGDDASFMTGSTMYIDGGRMVLA